MKFIPILFSLLIGISTIPTFALSPMYQEASVIRPDIAKCDVTEFYGSDGYLPMEMFLTFDPKAQATINVKSFDPASEFVQDLSKASQIGRISLSTNATDNFLIFIDLDYKTKNIDEPRIINFELYNSGKFTGAKQVVHEGFEYCHILLIETSETPRIPTPKELADLAKDIFSERLEDVEVKVDENRQTSFYMGLFTFTGVIALVIIIIILIAMKIIDNRGFKNDRKDLKTTLMIVKNTVRKIPIMISHLNINSTVKSTQAITKPIVKEEIVDNDDDDNKIIEEIFPTESVKKTSTETVKKIKNVVSEPLKKILDIEDHSNETDEEKIEKEFNNFSEEDMIKEYEKLQIEYKKNSSMELKLKLDYLYRMIMDGIKQ